MVEQGCRSSEHTLSHGMRAITLENEFVQLTLLPEKGGDIYSLVYSPAGVDVLWKSPGGLRPAGGAASCLGANSEAAWLEYYAGGWQEIFPNGREACAYKGAPLGFHGEASMLPWEAIIEGGSTSRVTVNLSVRLYRSPFTVEKRITLEQGRAVVGISEKVTNNAKEPMQFMWGHHPAFGAPFLGADCRIQVPARGFKAYTTELGPSQRLAPGAIGSWPRMRSKDGTEVDLSVVPGPDAQIFQFGHLYDLQQGWYALHSPRQGFGVGIAWPLEVFPYVWLWQELHGSYGYPWYGRSYVMALEPFSSTAGNLHTAIEDGTALTLDAGASLGADLAVVFFEGTPKITGISTAGTYSKAGSA